MPTSFVVVIGDHHDLVRGAPRPVRDAAAAGGFVFAAGTAIQHLAPLIADCPLHVFAYEEGLDSAQYSVAREALVKSGPAPKDQKETGASTTTFHVNAPTLAIQTQITKLAATSRVVLLLFAHGNKGEVTLGLPNGKKHLDVLKGAQLLACKNGLVVFSFSCHAEQLFSNMQLESGVQIVGFGVSGKVKTDSGQLLAAWEHKGLRALLLDAVRQVIVGKPMPAIYQALRSAAEAAAAAIEKTYIAYQSGTPVVRVSFGPAAEQKLFMPPSLREAPPVAASASAAADVPQLVPVLSVVAPPPAAAKPKSPAEQRAYLANLVAEPIDLDALVFPLLDAHRRELKAIFNALGAYGLERHQAALAIEGWVRGRTGPLASGRVTWPQVVAEALRVTAEEREPLLEPARPQLGHLRHLAFHDLVPLSRRPPIGVLKGPLAKPESSALVLDVKSALRAMQGNEVKATCVLAGDLGRNVLCLGWDHAVTLVRHHDKAEKRYVVRALYSHGTTGKPASPTFGLVSAGAPLASKAIPAESASRLDVARCCGKPGCTWRRFVPAEPILVEKVFTFQASSCSITALYPESAETSPDFVVLSHIDADPCIPVADIYRKDIIAGGEYKEVPPPLRLVSSIFPEKGEAMKAVACTAGLKVKGVLLRRGPIVPSAQQAVGWSNLESGLSFGAHGASFFGLLETIDTYRTTLALHVAELTKLLGKPGHLESAIVELTQEKLEQWTDALERGPFGSVHRQVLEQLVALFEFDLKEAKSPRAILAGLKNANEPDYLCAAVRAHILYAYAAGSKYKAQIDRDIASILRDMMLRVEIPLSRSSHEEVFDLASY